MKINNEKWDVLCAVHNCLDSVDPNSYLVLDTNLPRLPTCIRSYQHIRYESRHTTACYLEQTPRDLPPSSVGCNCLEAFDNGKWDALVTEEWIVSISSSEHISIDLSKADKGRISWLSIVSLRQPCLWSSPELISDRHNRPVYENKAVSFTSGSIESMADVWPTRQGTLCIRLIHADSRLAHWFKLTMFPPWYTKRTHHWCIHLRKHGQVVKRHSILVFLCLCKQDQDQADEVWCQRYRRPSRK